MLNESISTNELREALAAIAARFGPWCGSSALNTLKDRERGLAQRRVLLRVLVPAVIAVGAIAVQFALMA